MTPKELKSMEKFLQKRFPNLGISVRDNVKMAFLINTTEDAQDYIGQIKEAANEWHVQNGYGGADFGKPSYGL